jgi:Domain of unknown function (DUF4282)/Protein of unknown function (DUF2510)
MQMPAAPSYTAKGFFSSLFDTSFSSLIATRVIKVAYVIAIVIVSLEAVGGLVAAFATKEAGAVVAAIIFLPIVWLVSLIWIRILLELVIIIFRIGEDVRRISLSSVLAIQGQAVATGSGEQLFSSGVTPTETRSNSRSHTESPRQEASSQRAAEAGTAQSLTASHAESPRPERPPAGWYADPEREGYARFWSGESWTEQRRQLDSFG